ncbi:serine/threonine-protein kinase [soil metagenome]
MAAPLNAAEFAELTIRTGLLEDHVAKECVYELDDRDAPAEAMARFMERKGHITPLQTSRLLKGETDGYVLGGYRLLYKIASGSFGRVYRGSDPGTGAVVAVKVLRKKWTEDKKKIELFEREGRLGLSIQHPNIVQILAVNRDNITGQYFIVMEFVEGGNLRDILNIRKKVELDEAFRIMEECSSALAYASSRGLSHRDIKPTNILLSTDKVAKLVDFGLAEMSSGPQAMTSSVHKGGDKDDAEVDRTVDYAGLERVTGLKKGDIRSDIFFLGTVFFEMLTGHAVLPPTKDRNASMLRQRYEVDEDVRRLGLEYGLPSSVTALVAKMCAFDPEKRFQSPALMLEAVKFVHAEIAGGKVASRAASGPMSIFVVENNAKLQEVFREKFKKMGFRVLMSIDAGQALKRYQSAPFHAILIDVGSVGREGVEAFEKVQREAQVIGLDLTAILILNEDQAGYAALVKPKPGGHVFVRPVTMKQLSTTLLEGLGITDEPEA